MTIWVDAHLSPAIAAWIVKTFGISAFALRDLGLRDAEYPEIFEAAKNQGMIFMTKDNDFVDLVERLGAPPQIIWLTTTSSNRLTSKSGISSSIYPGLGGQLEDFHLLIVSMTDFLGNITLNLFS
jgi:predicted nuclease of predicted toxin-antitoxin system